MISGIETRDIDDYYGIRYWNPWTVSLGMKTAYTTDLDASACRIARMLVFTN
jgi:hypothetical protein